MTRASLSGIVKKLGGFFPTRLVCALVLAALLAVSMGASVRLEPGAAAPQSEAAPLQEDAPGGAAGGQTPAPADAPAASAPPLALGEDLFAYRLSLDGQVLALPASPAALLAAGWEMDAAPEQPIAPNEAADLSFTKDDWCLTAQVANLGGRPQPLQNGTLTALGIEAQPGLSVLLPGALTFGATRAQVLAAGGAPDEAAMETAGNVVRFTTARAAQLAFTLDAAGTVQGIFMQNSVEIATLPQAAQLPAEVQAYAAPAALGDDWAGFTVDYGGALYALPAPVAAFLENGWQLRDEAELAPGGWLMRVCLQRGTQVLRTTLFNPGQAPQPLWACFVAMVESSPAGCNVPLVLPGGVTREATLDEVTAAWGAPHVVDRTGLNTRDYYYQADAGHIILRFEREEGKMMDLEVWSAFEPSGPAKEEK